MLRILVWLLLAEAVLADVVVAGFGHALVADTQNPLRYEALEGMAIGVAYRGGAWLLAPVIAAWRPMTPPRCELFASFAPTTFGLVVIALVWVLG